MSTENENASSDAGYLIEGFQQLSKSSIWKMMMNFYDNEGIKAWSKSVVPYFITCNSFLANKYAILINQIIKNSLSPVYIVELGTGSGKLSFLILNELKKLQATSFTYVMTDFTQNNINYWSEHPSFKPFLSSGVLDFAKVDVYNTKEIMLINKKEKIPSNAHVIVIANYLFDSIACDAYRISQNIVYNNTIALKSKDLEMDLSDPSILQRMTPTWDSTEVSEENNCYLEWYKNFFNESFCDVKFTIPTKVLSFLEETFINRFSNVTLIAGDKSQTDPNTFYSNDNPFIAVHGSFSVTVNFHAIGLLFEQFQGKVFHSDTDGSIKISLFTTTKESADLENMYKEHIADFGPTDFFVLCKTPVKEITVDYANALIKLSRYDTDTFFSLKELYNEKLLDANAAIKIDFMKSINKLVDNFYLINKDKDIYFEIGRILYKLKEFNHALSYFKKSIVLVGQHNLTYHNIALCYKNMNQKEEALKHFKLAHELDATYESTRIMMSVLKLEMYNSSLTNLSAL